MVKNVCQTYLKALKEFHFKLFLALALASGAARPSLGVSEDVTKKRCFKKVQKSVTKKAHFIICYKTKTCYDLLCQGQYFHAPKIMLSIAY